MTQKSRLLSFLQSHPEGITSLEASRLDRPIMRLSERIRELEVLGYKFDRIDERTDNAKFIRYQLKGLRGVSGYHISKAEPVLCVQQAAEGVDMKAWTKERLLENYRYTIAALGFGMEPVKAEGKVTPFDRAGGRSREHGVEADYMELRIPRKMSRKRVHAMIDRWLDDRK